jgi:hypothetical protein
MARRTNPTTADLKPAQASATPRISLTLTQAESGEMVVKVGLTEFIAYSQNTGFTRLNLKGGKVVDVKESTDQIDRLVRMASAQRTLFDTP